MMRKWSAVFVAALFAWTSIATPAYAQILGIGGSRRPEARVLERVRANEFAADCTALSANIVRMRQGSTGVAIDLIDTALGAPPVARENVRVLAATQSMPFLQQLLQRFEGVQPPPAGIAPQIWVEESLQIDARQRAEGDIYLTRGLLKSLISPERQARGVDAVRIEQELGFIVAHEYAHILMCHYNRVAQSEIRRQSLGMAATLGVTALYFGTLRFSNIGGQVTVRSEAGEDFNQDVVRSMAGYTVLQTFNSSFLTPAWAGSQEREADWLAVELMREAGLGTEFVNELLVFLRTEEGLFAQEMSAVLVQIPPQALQAALISSQGAEGGASFGDMMRGVALRSGLDAFNRWRERRRGHFHDDPEDRARNIDRMLAFMGQAGERPPSAVFASAAQFMTAAPQELSVAELALDANRQLFLNDVPGGCTTATQALALGPAEPVALNAAAHCELARNDAPRAARHYATLIQSTLARPEDFVFGAELWGRANNRPRAMGALDVGSRRFGADAFYLPRMQVLAGLHDVEGVRGTAADCAIHATSPELRERCPVMARQLTMTPEELAAEQQAQPQNGIMDSLRNILPGQTGN